MTNKKISRGFTMFFAVLVASLALSVGLVIYDLFNRSLALSGVATQSQYAIYAADTGSECALYWDLKYAALSPTDQDGSAFATSSVEQASDVGAASTGINCNGQDIVGPVAPLGKSWSTNGNIGATYATTTFWFSMGAASSSPCAKVEVGKRGNPPQTTVIAHGYNTCTNNAPLRLERTLQINY